MKKTKLFSRLSLASALVLIIAASCKKSNNGSGGAGISASVNGTTWQSQYAIGVQPSNDSYVILDGYYGKAAGDTTNFEIYISDTAHINQADPFISSGVDFITSNKYYSGDPYVGGHGTITVTAWDKNAHTIAGTFSGVFYNTNDSNDSLTVANGHFNTTYLVE